MLTKSQYSSSKSNLILSVFISIVYAYVLSSLPHFLFKDRDNYLTIYAVDYEYGLSQIKTVLGFLFNEPVFYLVNKGLDSIWHDPTLTVKIIVFINCFGVSLFSLRSFPNIFVGIFFLVLLFFNVQFFATQLVTLRQGFGLVFLLLFYDRIKSMKWKLVFIASLGLIHNSFYIICAFVGINELLENVFKIDKPYRRIIFLILLGLIINAILVVITTLVGSKQSLTNFDNTSSGAMFAVWLIVFLVIISIKKGTIFNNKVDSAATLSILGLIIYLTSYFLSPIGGRIIGSFIPFIFLVLFKNLKEKELITLILLCGLNFFLFYNGSTEAFLAVKLSEFWHYFFLNF